jgi:hypothetical protein
MILLNFININSIKKEIYKLVIVDEIINKNKIVGVLNWSLR